MKVSELNGAQLDWAAAKAEGLEVRLLNGGTEMVLLDGDWWYPSESWAQGGPIIEREMITVGPAKHEGFMAWAWPKKDGFWGDSPLVAAMRCYVASKLGDEIELPVELSAEVN